MTHFNINSKANQDSRNMSPEQFKKIFGCNNPVEYYLNQKFKEEVKRLAIIEMIIKSEPDNPQTHRFKLMFDFLRKLLQDMVNNEIKELEKSRDEAIKNHFEKKKI